MYDVQSPSRRLALKERLYSLRMQEGKTLDSHLQDVNSIVTQLASLGVMIPDEDLVDQMLSSLPKSWSTFKAILQGRERSPTFTELQGSMLHEESSRITDRRDSDEVLYAQQSDGQHRQTSSQVGASADAVEAEAGPFTAHALARAADQQRTQKQTAKPRRLSDRYAISRYNCPSSRPLTPHRTPQLTTYRVRILKEMRHKLP